jgi:hypothetical protein
LFLASGAPGNWFGAPSASSLLNHQCGLGEIGIPMCYGSAGACMTTLAGTIPSIFDNDRLAEFLRGGVYVDAEAWRCLADRGLAPLTGVRSVKVTERDVIERLNAHPLNAAGRDSRRDPRPAYCPTTPSSSYLLEPSSPQTSELARLVNYNGGDLGCGMTAFENDLGGRVVVSGYYPWAYLHTLAKATQMKSICRWLTRERMPAVAESYARIIIWARGAHDRGFCFLLLNAGLDPAEDVVIRAGSAQSEYVVLHPEGERRTIESVAADDGQGTARRLKIGTLAPWSVCLVKPLPE